MYTPRDELWPDEPQTTVKPSRTTGKAPILCAFCNGPKYRGKCVRQCLRKKDDKHHDETK